MKKNLCCIPGFPGRPLSKHLLLHSVSVISQWGRTSAGFRHINFCYTTPSIVQQFTFKSSKKQSKGPKMFRNMSITTGIDENCSYLFQNIILFINSVGVTNYQLPLSFMPLLKIPSYGRDPKNSLEQLLKAFKVLFSYSYYFSHNPQSYMLLIFKVCI